MLVGENMERAETWEPILPLDLKVGEYAYLLEAGDLAMGVFVDFLGRGRIISGTTL